MITLIEAKEPEVDSELNLTDETTVDVRSVHANIKKFPQIAAMSLEQHAELFKKLQETQSAIKQWIPKR